MKCPKMACISFNAALSNLHLAEHAANSASDIPEMIPRFLHLKDHDIPVTMA